MSSEARPPHKKREVSEKPNSERGEYNVLLKTVHEVSQERIFPTSATAET
jgi:hypothetical protein